MNNPVIPPVWQSGKPLVSVGNGNTVRWGSFPSSANNAWSAAIGTVTGITFGSYQTPSGLTVTVTGYTSYLLQVSFVAKNNDTVSRTVNSRLQDTGNSISYSSGIGYAFAASQISSITNSAVVTNLAAGLSYTFAGQISFGGANGTVYNANLTVIGLG